jgi:hypothetical protein
MTTYRHLDTLVVPVTGQQLSEIRAGRTDLLARLILAAAGPATGLEHLLFRGAEIHIGDNR